MSIKIGDVTFTEEELQDGFSAAEVFSTPGSRGDKHGVFALFRYRTAVHVVVVVLLRSLLTVSSGILVIIIR